MCPSKPFPATPGANQARLGKVGQGGQLQSLHKQPWGIAGIAHVSEQGLRLREWSAGLQRVKSTGSAWDPAVFRGWLGFRASRTGGYQAHAGEGHILGEKRDSIAARRPPGSQGLPHRRHREGQEGGGVPGAGRAGLGHPHGQSRTSLSWASPTLGQSLTAGELIWEFRLQFPGETMILGCFVPQFLPFWARPAG